MQQADWRTAFNLATEGKNRSTIRTLYSLQGLQRIQQQDWAAASDSFAEAVRMARAVSIIDESSETGLALAKYRLGQLAQPEQEAVRLAGLKYPANLMLARLWLAMGHTEQAKTHALSAYKKAWDAGEPYVHRYNLTQATELLTQLGEPIPNLPPYNPANDKKFDWEEKVKALIEELRAEKKAKGG